MHLLHSLLLNVILLLAIVPTLPFAMTRFNVLKVGATRNGKTLSGVADMLKAPEEACVILDPHQDSLAKTALIHVGGNVLHACLSDIRHSIGFDLLVPSTNPDPVLRHMENH